MKDKIENKNIYQFDILRGVAIIGVFMVHTQYAIYPYFDFNYGKYLFIKPDNNNLSKYFSMSPFAFGWMGVILFFIISGFLIHYITIKKGIGNLNYITFFNKRFWRIYPPYLIALLFFTFFNNSLKNIISSPYDFLSHLFLLHIFNSNYFFSINGVFWSLAIEVQLYILYPLFLIIRNKFSIERTVLILLTLHILCTIYWGAAFSFKNLVIGNLVIRHWFTWAIGAYLAECYYYKKPFLSKTPNLFLVIGLILFYLSKLLTFHVATDSLFSTILIAIIVEKYLIKQAISLNYFEKSLSIVGLCSYSLYLIHLPLLQGLFSGINLFNLEKTNTFLFWVINTIPVFLIILLISYFSYLLIEKKSIRIGELLFKKETKKIILK